MFAASGAVAEGVGAEAPPSFAVEECAEYLCIGVRARARARVCVCVLFPSPRAVFVCAASRLTGLPMTKQIFAELIPARGHADTTFLIYIIRWDCRIGIAVTVL